MPSVDEFGAAVDAVTAKLDDTITALSAASTAGNNLADALQAMNADGRAAQTRTVVDQIDSETGQTTAFKQRITAIRTAIEALKGLLTSATADGGPALGTGQKSEQPTATLRRPPNVPPSWGHRTADSGKGVVWQRPGATGNADTVRVMRATQRYPHGYVRFYNAHGQPIGLNGKPGSRADTHIPIAADGTYNMPQGWNHA